ncbi:MAG TPA: hypothetical protein VEQ59_01620, partial [Polyangiaceae bacterium]|nr:hypothetical protein [Polyangiaceae bacterium]
GDALASGPTPAASHGVLARINAGKADWVQTGVPASDAAAGVTALALGQDGVTSVLSQRKSSTSAGGLFSTTYGIARFGDDGAWLTDLTLSTEYASGDAAALRVTADGGAVLAGILDEDRGGHERLLLRQVPSDGAEGWAFTLPFAGYAPTVELDRESGRVYTLSQAGVAVVDADGVSCRQYALPDGEKAGLLAVAAPYLYVWVDGEIRRYRLPEE